MINYDLTKIRALVFDIDGVLSAETIPMDATGTPLRTVNIKDGYALQKAVKSGLCIAIITGAKVEAIRVRYAGLGIKDIYLGCAHKWPVFEEFLQKHHLEPSQVLYMGDDIPDLPILRQCGCPCCPADAAPEIVEASIYVSQHRGGYGCGRDVVEQVLRAQDKWLDDEKAFGW